MFSKQRHKYLYQRAQIPPPPPRSSASEIARKALRDTLKEQPTSMTIAEAAKLVTASNGYMYRRAWGGRVIIKPTNDVCCCIAWPKDGCPAPHWEPKARDLTATDWEVRTEGWTEVSPDTEIGL